MPGSELTTRILFGMGAGVLLGVLLNWIGFEAGGFLDVYVVDGLFHVVGSVFLASLKLLVVPLVFVSIVCGTAALDDLTKLGRVGGKTLVLYLVTTAVAISLALIAASIIAPGAGLALSTVPVVESTPAPPLPHGLCDLFPRHPPRGMS